MRAWIGTVVGLSIVAAAVGLTAAQSTKESKRIGEAATVLREIHRVPDKDIPQDLWDKAECVMVIPSLKKAAFVFGGEYGKGLMSCRHDGAWSAPIFMQLGKGSWGLQIGAQSIDLVLLVMNQSGAEKLLGNKVSLGAEASIAGGPVGRDARAATDAQLQAEILSVLADAGAVRRHQSVGRDRQERRGRQPGSLRRERDGQRRADVGNGQTAGGHAAIHGGAGARAASIAASFFTTGWSVSRLRRSCFTRVHSLPLRLLLLPVRAVGLDAPLHGRAVAGTLRAPSRADG